MYIGNWDEKKKIITRYQANDDGTLSNGIVFFDMTAAPGEWAPSKRAHNFAWGDEDAKTLYLCARNTLYKMPLKIPGIRP